MLCLTMILKPLSAYTILKYSSKIPRRILKRVQVADDKGCWIINSKDWSSYTTIDKEPAHRFIYKLINPNESIIGFHICHKCDRPGCIHPEHLFKGTASDNQKDAFQKGRRKYMNRNKLTSLELDRLRTIDRQRQLILPADYFRSAYLRK